jgi:hypothetical protein
MPDFPAFLKTHANRIASSSQFTEDIEGFVFDGADGNQVALWTAHADRASTEHVHDFDEYVILGSERIELLAGQEFVIPKGTRQRMEVAAGTRTMHVFGGKRARREGETEQ